MAYHEIELLEGTITEVHANQEMGIPCLNIMLNFDGFVASYPPCRTPGGVQAQEELFKQVFEVEKLEQAIAKPLVILFYNSIAVALFNKENERLFSLHATFFPEKELEKLKKNGLKEAENLPEGLSLHDQLLLKMLKINEDLPWSKHIQSTLLYDYMAGTLEKLLPEKEPNKPHKLKI